MADLETLNIVSTGAATINRIVQDKVTAKQVITGNTALTLNMFSGVAGNVDAGAFTANVVLFKLTTTGLTLSGAGSIEQLFKNAIGTSVITGLAADANYLVSVYETANSKTVYAVVNTGASGAGDTSLSAADFTDQGMSVIALVGANTHGAGVSFGLGF